MATTHQPNFAAGELGPRLHGRTDLALYAKGLKTCRNFFPTVEGQLVSRAGSMLVRETKGSETAHAAGPGSAANTQVRLIPFIFSGGQAYVLEFGNQYVRFHAQGGTIESAPGVPLEIASPYGWASLKTLQFAQVGNIMVLTHPGYDAYQLERLTHTNWTLTTVSYTPPAWPGLPFFEPRLNPLSVLGNTGYMSNPMLQTLAAPDATHPAQEWIWCVTLLGQNVKTGKRFESLPFVITQTYDGLDLYPTVNPSIADLPDHMVPLYKDYNPVIISAVRMASGPRPDFIILGLNIYRGRGGMLYGLVGNTLNKAFVDRAEDPNYALQPPLGTNPFRVLNPDGSVQRIEKPMAVAFFEDRLTFGGAYDNDKLIRVGTLFFSSSGQWDKFDRYLIPVATQALEYELATTQRQEIRTLLAMKRLLVGTDSAVISFGGSGGDALAADVLPLPQIEAGLGCSHLRFLVVRSTPLFAAGGAADGAGADGFAYGLSVHALQQAPSTPFAPGIQQQAGVQSYVPADLSAQAHHLFYGSNAGFTHQLRDWAYAEKPWQLVWIVRNDGTLLSLTYDESHRSAGWARHDTDGAFENVCAIPEGNETAVYVVVKRTINGEARRYVERMTSRLQLGGPGFSAFGAIAQVADDICVDSGKSYYGAPTTHLTGLDHLEGKAVWVIGPNKAPQGPFNVVGGAIDITDGTANVNAPLVGDRLLVYVGQLYQPEMETLNVVGDREKQKVLKGVFLEVDRTAGLQMGFDLTHLKPWNQRTPAMGYGPVLSQTILAKVSTTGTWNDNARAALRQTLPLPVTVVGLTREVVIGG